MAHQKKHVRQKYEIFRNIWYIIASKSYFFNITPPDFCRSAKQGLQFSLKNPHNVHYLLGCPVLCTHFACVKGGLKAQLKLSAQGIALG